MADEVEMFFFPFMGGGHQIPMIDLARLFASHGVKSTIIATPDNALSFQWSIARDRDSGRPISIHNLELPPGSEPPDSDMSAAPFTDTSMLQEPLRILLIARPPNCIDVDMFHRWSADVIDAAGVPRIVFSGNGCFSRSVYPVKFGQLDKFTGKQYLRTAGLEASGYPYIWAHGKTLEMVQSEYDPFEIPGLPDRIVMTRSQLPHFHKQKGGGKPPGRMSNSEDRSLGVVVNSFLELEQAYVGYFKKEMAKKAWVVGPVSLCNRKVADKAERGQQAAIDEHSCLSWLNAKEPNSVLYVSFGSLARLAPEQLLEIAYGLEASSFSFIWAAGEIFESLENGEGGREDWLPSGFEERLTESERGLIIRGWAPQPQPLILEHPSVDGFMTHRGWNSILDGVSAGVPMVTFPHSPEQFFNEKLVTDVLRIGVRVGSMVWTSWNTEPGPPAGREKVEAAVRKLMDGGKEAAETRRKAKELGETAKRAVEAGGSSYEDVEALIKELKSRKKV